MKASRRGFLASLCLAPLIGTWIAKRFTLKAGPFTFDGQAAETFWRVSWADGIDTFTAESPSLMVASEYAYVARYGRPGYPGYGRITRRNDKAAWNTEQITRPRA